MEITPARRSALGLVFGLVAFFLLLRYTISLERQSGGFRVGLKSAPSKTVEDHASVEHGVDLRLEWEGKAVPPTKLLHHYPGADFSSRVTIQSQCLFDTCRVDHF